MVGLCAVSAAFAADFLQPATSPEPAQAGPAGAAVGDVDNDGDVDIVTSALFSTAASTLLNDGAGDFTEVPIGSNGATIDAGLGNFDADSNLDLVLLYPQTPPAAGLMAMFRGNGDGTFTFVSFNALVATGVRPTQLWVEDFNGDGTDDVAVVNSQFAPTTTNGTVMVFFGNPANNDTFAQATPNFTMTAELGATDVVGGNFNGGARDLVVSNYQSNSISLLSGLGTGNFTVTNIGTTVSPFYLDAADLNGDGHTDVVATVRFSNPTSVRTLFGDGTGAFPAQTTVTAATAATGTQPQQVVARNFDTDGDVDLAIANGVPNTVSVLDNDGTGTFTIAPTSPETGLTTAGTVPFGIVSADFDGSTFDDLAVTVVFTAPGQVSILLNETEPVTDLSIDKQDTGFDPVDVGEDITYTLVVTNAGPSGATNVHATDTLPPGLTFESSPDGCTESGGVVDCDFGTVASGATETQTFVVSTDASAAPSVSDTATVDGDGNDPDPSDNSDTETTTVNASADLSIDKQDTGSDPVSVGDDITYTLVVTNSGPSGATNVHATDTLPAGLTFESSPDGCTESGGVVDCDFGSVASGATETQSFVVATDASAAPSVSDTATVDGDEEDPDPSDNSDTETTTVNAAADLSLDKRDTGFDPVNVGDDITYALVVTNAGPSAASNVHATDTLPPGLTFESSADGCTESGGVVDCDFGTVASGASETQTFIVSTDSSAAPSVSDTATVDGDETDPDPSDNSDTETTTVNAATGGGPPPPQPPSAPSASSADLSIDKRDTGFDPVNVGDDITYALVVTNAGPSAASNVHASDTLPAGLTFESSPDGCTESAGVVDCNFGSVASGATETQSFVVSTDASAAPSVSDTATVDGDEADPDLTDNSDTETTTVGVSATCKSRTATLTGTSAADVLVGTPGDDVIAALGGNDVVLGAAGNDLICGGGGNDRLVGGLGSDELFGGLGVDRLLGGRGGDLLHGGIGDDTLNGGRGNDRLVGRPGKDLLLGKRGEDRLNGGRGDDTLNGGAGRDRLVGGPGNDRLIGGLGNDGLFGGPRVDLLLGGRGDDTLNGGAGRDRLLGGPGNDRSPRGPIP